MTPQQHYESLARSLTIDQAYARAYGDLRRLLISACDNYFDEVAGEVVRAATAAVAARLERELCELLYSEETAKMLARPE